VTTVVFLLLLPAVIVLAGSWAWRYLERLRGALSAPRRHDHPMVRLDDVSVTAADQVTLLIEHPDQHRIEPISVALDVPSITLSTLQAWHDAHARLLLIVPPETNIVRLRRVDRQEAVTLRRVAG
jgi:hypothetical protein